jgi:lysophospholipase L1-like esterase
MKLLMRFAFLLCLLLFPGSLRAEEKTAYPPLKLPDTSSWGKNIQRTMRLLATSTPEQRHTVRVLFYGQSITEQKWSQFVAEDLKQRFPNANLVIENRSLGGFASQLLVKTAESDLYPFQPDLLIFHVYGAHDKYEDIIRRTRERTSAEILIQTDHLQKPEEFDEETDASKLPPAGKHWGAFMNHNWLPSIAKKYQCELCDQRALWKQYLKINNLQPKDLLKDGVHLNAHGEWLMAECVKAYLRYDPKLGPSPAEAWIKTYEVGKDAQPKNGELVLDIDANRLQLISNGKPGKITGVTINGQAPAELAPQFFFTRASSKVPGKWAGKWPVVAPITSEAPPIDEEWTMQVKKAGDDKTFTFELTGSKTGPDGSGRSDTRFVSNSKRVVIEPDAWNAGFALAMAGHKPVPDEFPVTWKTQPRFVTSYELPQGRDPGNEMAITVAAGLPAGKKQLRITFEEECPLKAVRAYRTGEVK